MQNYRDESFILQFLSPKVMREFGMMHLAGDEDEPFMTVDRTAGDDDFAAIRSALAAQYRVEAITPDISVVRYRRETDRALLLRHQSLRGKRLSKDDAERTLQYLRQLWGYPVTLESLGDDGKPLEHFYNGLTPLTAF